LNAREEANYDQYVYKLTKQKTEKAKLTQILAADKADLIMARDDCELDLISAQRAKDQIKFQLD
jgi:hypothetical protein